MARTELQLRNLRDADPNATEGRAEVTRALGARSAAVVAAAARIVEDNGLTDLEPHLAAAFDRMLTDPVKRDPGCLAKVAIARALDQLETRDPTVFRSGIHHIQREPVWGGSVDTAVELRARCCYGLAAVGVFTALTDLTDRLSDPEARVRGAAARAIAHHGDPAGTLLLRLKLALGDEDAEVDGECMAALLTLDPDESFDRVQPFLRHDDPVRRELAALAIGESRLERALPVLTDWLDATLERDLRRTGFLAIALLRSDAALAVLLTAVRDGRKPDATHAIEAGKVFGPEVGPAFREAAALRTDLGDALDRAFATDDL